VRREREERERERERERRCMDIFEMNSQNSQSN
jgi:hypothetical protein